MSKKRKTLIVIAVIILGLGVFLFLPMIMHHVQDGKLQDEGDQHPFVRSVYLIKSKSVFNASEYVSLPTEKWPDDKVILDIFVTSFLEDNPKITVREIIEEAFGRPIVVAISQPINAEEKFEIDLLNQFLEISFSSGVSHEMKKFDKLTVGEFMTDVLRKINQLGLSRHPDADFSMQTVFLVTDGAVLLVSLPEKFNPDGSNDNEGGIFEWADEQRADREEKGSAETPPTPESQD